MDPNTLRQLNAIESLEARYCRGLDTKEWPALDSVLADDIEVDQTALGGDRIAGAANYVAALQNNYGRAVTVHHAHMPEIELTSPTTATGTWAMQVLVVRPDGHRVLGFGHDYDTYGIRNGRWVLTATKSTRLHLDRS
ncbi:nuclear transport factor 2 family protein [Nocardia mexicana]|uniref:SnoaL-like protein n=1 Tax=Nocardia mexicana TaxID=279262 RepID=A0A370GN50_9NOCA|nr:nuclear transport factor 2 family protein [Nocardia mexicana]RDI45097.1 SnoaL-like protein [Nocardia mexicana]